MEHHLKTWPPFFRSVCGGTKTFEVRKGDRDFNSGDVLVLQEWRPDTKEYTGSEARFVVTYTLTGFGIAPGYVCMAIKPEGAK